MEPVLEIKNLMVFYENALAINDFSLVVQEGEFVSVLGSNSAGKTTLMNTVAGLIEEMRIKEKRKGGTRITVLGEIIFRGEEIIKRKPKYTIKLP